jgi:ketosteroid isomerase-like protein
MKTLAAITLAFALVAFTTASHPTAHQTAQELYTCSMHPGVAEAKPGSCPVCSMTLKARPMNAEEKSVADFLNAYDAAFVAKDLEKLGTMYTNDTTVFEGGGINDGWKDYRDRHLGPELKSFEGLEFAHSNVVPHLLGADAAYVTADYTLKTKSGDRVNESGGLATYTLVRSAGAWKIRHTHTSAKRRPAGGGI